MENVLSNVPNEEEARVTANSYAADLIISKGIEENYGVKELIKQAFLVGVSWMASECVTKEDFVKKLSDAYSNLKDTHWNTKQLMIKSEHERKLLKAENIELRAKINSMIDQLTNRIIRTPADEKL